MQILALIPARGGSEGIPRKNVLPFAGKPLVAHSIAQAKEAASITRVLVSTDDHEIAAISCEWGADVVPRPAEISGDKASSESALLHALDWLLTTEHFEPDLVVFLQATSPMRAPDDIQRAIETLEREGADSLFSACRVEGFTWRLVDGVVAPVNYDPAKRPLRQELKEEIWEENGSFYIFKPWVLRKFNSRLGGRIAMHKMERAASFQIDEPGDFELIEHLMGYRKIEDGRLKMEERAEGGNLKPEEKAEGGNLKPENAADRGDFQFSAFSRQPSAAAPQVSGLSLHPSSAGSQVSGLSFHPSTPSSISHLLSSIQLLVLDFDGVLTDNRVLVTQDGTEAVFCSREDGLGLEMLRKSGRVEVIVISKEKNPVVTARCRKLGVQCVQGCDDKLAALKQLAVSGLRPAEIAYVGNDVNDLECMRWVGLPIAVADAAAEVLAVAKRVTSRPGGHGAVREVTDWILASRAAAPENPPQPPAGQNYFIHRDPPQAVDYEQAYWGTIVDPDGRVRNRVEERQKHLEDVKQELEFVNSLKPGRILDVGCGLGFLLSGLNASWEKHGVEVSRFAAENASQWAKIHMGDLKSANYPHGSFDVVVMHHVIEHIDDPIAAILEVSRILRAGGILVLGTPDFDSGVARRFRANYRLLHDPTHVSLFTNESMHRFLRDHEFIIDRVEYPFFETLYFTLKNLTRLFDTSKISPPFYGNFMTFYCHKPGDSA